MTTQPTTRDFDLGDILSVTTGLLLSPRHIEGVYDILNWMTGDNLTTHQLPRASEECRPELFRQHPKLAAVAPPDQFDSEEHIWSWLAEQVAIYGKTLPVAPLNPADHTSIDPTAELKMMRPDMPILEVDL